MPTVNIYSTTTCPFCKIEKTYLEEKGIAFTNIFVDEQPEKVGEMVEKSGQMGVPVTVVSIDGKEEVVIGFDRDRLNTLLGIS